MSINRTAVASCELLEVARYSGRWQRGKHGGPLLGKLGFRFDWCFSDLATIVPLPSDVGSSQRAPQLAWPAFHGTDLAVRPKGCLRQESARDNDP